METTTPDTLNYMIGGFVVFTVVFFGYLAYLAARWNSLTKEAAALEQLDRLS